MSEENFSDFEKMLFDEEPAAEPVQPAAQEEPQKTQAPDLRSDAEKWREYLSQFETPEEARKQVKPKHLETGWALGTGYRAIKQIKKWKTKTKAKEATFKIAKVDVPEPEPVKEEPIPAPYFSPQPAAEPQPTYQQPQYMPIQQPQLTEQLLGKTLKNGWNMLCDFSKAPEANLSDKESAELAEYLNPVVQTRFPQVANNPEVIALIGASSIMLPKVKVLMDARKRQKLEAEFEQSQPAAEPVQPAAQEEPQVKTDNPLVTQPVKDSKPKWIGKLPH